MWDLGGQKSFREHWKCYYPNTQGIVYVIDSSDWSRIDLARQELCDLMAEEDLRNAPVLVLANKQDLPGVMSEKEIENRLWLHNFHRNIKIFAVSAKNNTRVESALDWLVTNINT